MNEEHSIWVEVSTAAIRANVAALKELLGDGVRLLAVVKANGYGHGDAQAAQAAIDGGADWLGVARVQEGESVRGAGIDAPILLLAEPPHAAVDRAVAARLTPTIYTSSMTKAFADRAPKGYPVHVKVDTGMHRYGVAPDRLKSLLDEIDASRVLELQGLSSHMAVAEDVSDPYTTRQLELFMDVIDGLGERASGLIKHIANSAATMTLPRAHLDMVRPGIAIYGIHPSPALRSFVALTPALSFKSRIGLVKRLPAGESISYGQRYRLKREANIATIPCGYADGLSRALTNKGEVLIGGKAYRISGTITMDHFLVDLGDDLAEPGDEVVIIGSQADAAIDAHKIASTIDTIPYEIVCGISARVPRLYV